IQNDVSFDGPGNLLALQDMFKIGTIWIGVG
ncbi:MAG: hypothetical protein EZS28_030181, partial [Streblomastix strix]